MADPDLLTFIREYDMIFLTETMKGNDYTLVLPGYQFHHVIRTFKHKNASRASGGIGILVANKFDKHTRIDLWSSGKVNYNYIILWEKH